MYESREGFDNLTIDVYGYVKLILKWILVMGFFNFKLRFKLLFDLPKNSAVWSEPNSYLWCYRSSSPDLA